MNGHSMETTPEDALQAVALAEKTQGAQGARQDRPRARAREFIVQALYSTWLAAMTPLLLTSLRAS